MAKKSAKSSSEGSKTPAPKKKAAAKSPAKSSTPAAGGVPQIDTNLAANAAAALVGRKISLNAPKAPKQESAAFKNLKEGLSKPHLQGLNSVLETTNQNKKASNLPIGGQKQVAHNQTFGADVTRSGVPRRTPG